MAPTITTLTLNPAIDRTVKISGFAAGAVNRVEHVEERVGGKGINVAAALAGQGQAVSALGFLGRENDVTFRSFFAARRIQDRCLRLPGLTRTGIKIVDPLRGETTDINFPGLTPSAGDLEILREQISGLSGGWCVLAGSLPPGVPPEIYREFITLLKARGVHTVLDTSGPALKEALRMAPHVIKPNVHELEAYLGRALPTQDDIIAAARDLVADGISLVVVSRGADGACFVDVERAVVARPPAVEVNSTVGAGDAMVAGVVAAKILGLPLSRCARLATAFSLSALTRTNDAADSTATIEGFVSRVDVTTVKL